MVGLTARYEVSEIIDPGSGFFMYYVRYTTKVMYVRYSPKARDTRVAREPKRMDGRVEEKGNVDKFGYP